MADNTPFEFPEINPVPPMAHPEPYGRTKVVPAIRLPYTVPTGAANEAYGGDVRPEPYLDKMDPLPQLSTPATDAIMAEVRWKLRKRWLWRAVGGNYIEQAVAFVRYRCRQIKALFTWKD